ncbi:coiled-coil protein [Pyrobaculum aerophilum]|uniref:Archaeal coiled-coil protein n=1 Tax=Pyrobaculum aerophilum TaxID=13773 RepID=A0A371R6R1_9CREN|nr:hypothetical protein [Pyrobaculum aerophilum]RFA95685.1 hypothetical protein CGL51_07300 [Pyrobaculum aerophilum]RFB00200.1 hypothetical protein CGL52_00990 [Pyrobaculum aerophilum]
MLNKEELLEKIREVNSQLDEIQRQIDGITNEINSKRALLDEIRKQIAEVKSLIEGKRNQLQKTRELIGSLVERKSQIINQIRTLRNELLQINITLQKYREKMTIYRNLLSTINEYVGGKPLEKEKLKRIIEQLEYFFETSPTSPEWERQFIKYISQIEKELNLADSMEKVKAHIAELRAQIDDFKNKRESIRNEIARLVQDLTTVKQELSQLKASRQEIYKELTKLKEKREELKKRREELKAEILQLALKRKELREKRRAVQEELEKYNVLLKALELAEKNKARAAARELRAASLKERAEALYNKLLNGERLTHEEIKILIEAGYLPEE